MSDQKIIEALKISSELDKIIAGEKYKDGFYKDDDVTLKSVIKQKDIDDLMLVVENHNKHLLKTKKEIDEQILTPIEEDRIKIEASYIKGEEFFLKGSTNFMSGFDSPNFYIENGILFFQVKPIDGEIDLAEISVTIPGKKPITRVEGGVINDGVFVKLPIEIGILQKDPETKYTVLLTSTNKQMKATFNYVFKG